MSTLATNNRQPTAKRKKGLSKNRSFTLVLLSVLCIAIDNIYAIFGHGVRSAAMSFMFLYPLGAAVVFFLLTKTFPRATVGKLGRTGVNLLCSGISTLTAGSFLVGILEIAGSSSAYVWLFFLVGWILTAGGLLRLVISGIQEKIKKRSASRG